MKVFELERPVLAVDVVIFSIDQGKLSFLLYKRDKDPFKNAPALPGVGVQIDETLENAARRAIFDKINKKLFGPDNLYLEQLAAFDAINRDPRGRTVSVAYMGITPIIPQNFKDLIWQPVQDSVLLPFDHNLILDAAVHRLQGKLKYTTIAKWFLPKTFRIEHLQSVYEAILNKTLNRSNFRNKLLKIGLIEKIKILNKAVGKKGGRPPHLYQFTGNGVEAAGRDFL